MCPQFFPLLFLKKHLLDDITLCPCVFTQNAAVYSTRVHTPGRYVFIIHYHQPLHPTFPVRVYITGGRIWQGKTSP